VIAKSKAKLSQRPAQEQYKQVQGKAKHFESKLSQGDKPSSKPFLRQGAIKGRLP
jgi:hypothetical protein